MVKKIEELIKDREIKSIAFMLIIKIITLIPLELIQFFTQKDIKTGIFITSFVAPVIIILIFFLFLLKKRIFVNLIGYISVLMDIIIIWILPFIWYYSVGGEEIPRTYLLKTAFPPIIFTFLVLNSISLKPEYPLILSLATVPLYIVLYIYAGFDPRFKATSDYVEGIIGAAVHKDMYFSNISSTLLFGFLLFFATRSIKKLIYKSVDNEVKNSHLSRYFSPQVVEKISMEEESFFKPGGQTQSIAVLFSDIRNFTNLTESHTPDEILYLLSEYHKFMISIIFKNNGTLDKFIGDGMLATFGTPVLLENPSENAVKAALEIREQLIIFNKKRRDNGLFTIEHGIGIHFGPAIVGNIGIENRLEYTVIGDTVNIASRIEGRCKHTGQDILISETVKSKIENNFKTEFIEEEIFKGKSYPIKLFSVKI